MKKWIKWGSVFVFVCLIGLFVVLDLFLGSIVKKGIETVGPQMTQTSVNVKFVGISPLSGKGHIRGLSIGNPKGYSSNQAIEFKEFKVNVIPRSLTQPVTVVQSAYIDSPIITYEHGPGGTNLASIQRNVEAFARKFDTGGSAEKTQKSKKIVIEDLLIRNAKVNAFGTSLMLSEIHLTNLGKDSGGLTAAEIVNRVLGSLTSGIASSLPNVVESGKKTVTGVVAGLKTLFGK